MTGLGTISVHAERLPISDPRRKPNQSILNRWLKAPAKRSQNFDTAYRNIVGAFGHHVATCCDTLGVVGSNLKMVKFFTQRLWMFAAMLRQGMRTSSIFNSQNVLTCRNRVAKRTKHVAPNNVAISCVVLRSFGRTLSLKYV